MESCLMDIKIHLHKMTKFQRSSVQQELCSEKHTQRVDLLLRGLTQRVVLICIIHLVYLC